jgi:hypothetical protein
VQSKERGGIHLEIHCIGPLRQRREERFSRRSQRISDSIKEDDLCFLHLPLLGTAPPETKPAVLPKSLSGKVLHSDSPIGGLVGSILGSINIFTLDAMVKFQMLHEPKLGKAGWRLPVTGSKSALKVTVGVLDVFDESGFHTCRSSVAVIERASRAIMAGS